MDLIKEISQGTYGIVYLAKDKEGKEIVVKRNLVDHDVDGLSSIRELDVTFLLRMHPNIIKLTGVSYGPPFKEFPPLKESKMFKDDILHFILEKGDCDLTDYLTEKDLSLDEVRYLMFDLMQGLEFIHANSLIHRDIKPANLLLFDDKIKKRKVLKICDFGLSKPRKNSGSVTPRIVTAWYRSPEILLNYSKNQYDYAIDIWSAGVILWEMLTGIPLCLQRKEKDSSEEYIKTLSSGIPKECTDGIKGISQEDLLKKITVNFLSSKDREDTLNLILSLLNFDPKKRPTAKEALNFDFFSSLKSERVHLPVQLRESQVYKGPERKILAGVLIDTYNRRSSLSWYKHEILFQTASLFDRFLFWNKGKEHSREGLILRVISCLYISIKYFLTVEPLMSLKSILNDQLSNKHNQEFILDFEILLVRDILRYRIYEPTVYEISSSSLTEEQTRDLLLRYLS